MRRSSSLSLAGVALPRECEALHLLLAGTTASGKTTAISELLDGIRARGDLATVSAVAGGRVTLILSDGQQRDWQPAFMSNVGVHTVEVRQLAETDRVRVTANNRALGVLNGDLASVTGITGQSVTLRTDAGKSVVLPLGKPLHLDHGYCSTVHASQGKTCERVFVDANISSATLNQSLYYVAISRARSEVKLYTDDESLLAESMGRLDRKSAALDVPRRGAQMSL